MLKRLRKIFENSQSSCDIIPRSKHGIRDQEISSGAIKVIEKLSQQGFHGYLVGGGVRDLLLGSHPKDFDIATDATPEQVKKIFNRSRIIGKRFRIVHVRFGREIIEVTTFRAHHGEASSEGEARQNEKGLLLRDNVYGDIVSDAARRDFTVNALYYNPIKGEVLDFTKGMDDLKSRTLRIIGNANSRYKEDPVRLLRAVRFAAKLGFEIEAATEAPIREHAEYLSDIPAARLFEEVLKLFMSGSGTATMNLLNQYGLLRYLFPSISECMQDTKSHDCEFVTQAIINTDKRIRQNKRVTPAFIYAAFLWPQLREEMRTLINDQKLPVLEALQRASHGVVGNQLSYTAIPKRFLIPMREIWALQFRLPKRDGNRAFSLVEHPRFRAAYDFLLLREQAGENLNGLGSWWTKFQASNDDVRQEMVDEIAPPRRKPRKRRS